MDEGYFTLRVEGFNRREARFQAGATFMAKTKVTGYTQSEVAELRQEYLQRYDEEPPEPFEDHYCLARIPNQPDDYDGPQRYCANDRYLSQLGDNVICKYHGGAGEPQTQNLDKLAAMEHGMHATQENLVEDFDDKDEALYDWVMHEWPDAYDIDFDEEPAALHDLHRLAVEIVRAERGRGFILEEGEVHEDPVRDEEGAVVVNSRGEVETEKSEHYLAQMLHRQDKKITNLEKELGVSRKEQLRQDTAENATDIVKNLTELGTAFLDRESNEYDPDDQPWQEDE